MEDSNEMDMSFEDEMEFKSSLKRMKEMADHADELGERFVRYLTALEDAEKLADDPAKCKAALFKHAEWFDSLKPITDGSDLTHEEAREIDWLRHVLDDYSYRKSKGRDDWEDCSDGEGTFFCLQKDKDTFVSARIEEVPLL